MRDRNSMLGSKGCVLKVGIKQTDFILVLVFLSFNNPRFYRSRVFETCGETYTCFENNTASGTIFRKILLIYSYRRGEERFVYIDICISLLDRERERERGRSISFCNSNYLHLRYHTRSVYHFSCLRTIRQMYDTSLDN